jgi:hypothetical protein
MTDPPLSATRTGIAVHCGYCHQMKCPRGRSQPLGAYYCDHECPGYDTEPHVGSLWPGETEAEFGYPVGTIGTKDAQP